MKIWMLDADVDIFDWLDTVKDFDVDERQTFDGRSKINNWEPLAVKVMEPDEGEILNQDLGNTPGFHSHIPVFDKKALDCLKDLMEDFVEILPLLSVDGEFYAINVTTVLNCIDYDRAEYEMFSDGNRIMCFDKYVFKEDIVKGKHIFKIVDERLGNPFVSDEFRKKVLKSGLRGFKFELVWDSDN